MANFLTTILAKAGINVGTATGAAAGEVKASGAVKTPTPSSCYMPFNTGTSLSPYTVACDALFGAVQVNATFRRYVQWAIVATTNNASNYWTITLISAGSTTIKQFNTSAQAAGSWFALVDNTLSATADSSTFYVIRLAKVGSPGALSLAATLVWVE